MTMDVYEVIFSPTGGTKKVADAIAADLGPIAGTADLTSRATQKLETGPDTLAVIAVPSYGGRMPALAVQRLQELSGGGCPAVLVCVYGNRAYEDTLCELQMVAEKAGFRPVAAVAAVAEHSIAHTYAAGRPDKADKEELHTFAERIRTQLAGSKSGILDLPGKVPSKPASTGGMVPRAGKTCTECGTCAAECPAGAIDPGKPTKADRHRCISCMRCVAVCPHQARRLHPLMTRMAGIMLRKACSQRRRNELFLLS